MNTIVDPQVRLSIALNASPGAYAVLLGSGISAAAGVLTGRQMVSDLIGRIAALEGTTVRPEDAFAWYRAHHGEEPDYSKLLDAIAASPTERAELLRRYFEPTAEQRQSGVLVPSAAHRALAQLAARGAISMFLTTNFDRLLELALEAVDVAPTVLATPDSLEGAGPIGRARCTVVKLHGDYLDTRIKNTREELESYHPAIDRLLDRVIDEYGLIVCGWSADWDPALRRAFERSTSRRYSTFWLSRRPLAGAAALLAKQRGAEFVQIEDADAFFVGLASKVAALSPGRTVEATKASVSVPRLPSRPTAFIGRARELEEVERWLTGRSKRLLTLVGPGGTGKSTLAIQALGHIAPAFADGAAFVDLSNTRKTEDVLVAIARAIHLAEAIERSLGDVLTAHLSQRDMLLVLDNFEQVTEAANAVAQLLVDCPGLSILVTSREPLRLRGEQLFPVPPLSLPEPKQHVTAHELEASEAVQLFVDRARAVRPDFALDDGNAATIAEICRRLDGLPLAIELAAARLRLLSPQALQNQLHDRLNLLRSGPRDLPERQQTLRATMNWSYELLTTHEQRLFDLLAVFAGADIAAIEAVAAQTEGADGLDILDGLTSLLEKSLVVQAERLSGAPGVRMLETIREFASDRLEQTPQTAERARRAHALHYARLTDRLLPDLTGSRRIEAIKLMIEDLGNLRLAWEYWLRADDLEQLQKLASGVLILDEARGWYGATVQLTTDMLAVLDRSGSSPERASQEIALRTSLARALMASKGYTPEVEEAYARSIDLFESGTDARQKLSTLRGLAFLYNLRGEGQRGARIGTELIDLSDREHDPAMGIEGRLLTGTTKIFTNDLAGGLAVLDEAIALFPRTPLHAFSSRDGGNDPRVVVYTTSAIALQLMGYPAQAAARANRALLLAAQLELPFTSAYADFHAGLVFHWQRDFETVLERMNSAIEVAEEHGFHIWRAAGAVLAGAAEAGLGRGEGLARLRRGMNLYQGLRSPPIFWPILLWIEAAACGHAGRPSEGLGPIDAALDLMEAGDGTILVPELQITKGDLVLLSNPTQTDDAQRWYRRALDRAQRLHARTAELRAATRLCRYASGDGDSVSAALALRGVLDGFTEGADTSDVVDARAMLDERRQGRMP